MDELTDMASQVAKDVLEVGVGTVASQGAKDLLEGTAHMPVVTYRFMERFAFSEILSKLLGVCMPIAYLPGMLTSFCGRLLFNQGSVTRKAEETAVNGGISILAHLFLGPWITPLGATAVSSAAVTIVDQQLFGNEEDESEILRKIQQTASDSASQLKSICIESPQKTLFFMGDHQTSSPMIGSEPVASQPPSSVLRDIPQKRAALS